MPQMAERKRSSREQRSLMDRATAELQLIWRSMTRERFIDFLKTMVWVAPLTVLIWVYAEQQQVQSMKGITALIAIKDTNPADILYLDSPQPQEGDPQEGLITVDISGSQGAVDDE